MGILKQIGRANFAKLFLAVFFSELGGYLTNTVILIHLFKITEGNKFYLGLAQMMFVGPLAIGTLLGGSIGETFNRRKVMMICECVNLALVFGLLASTSALSIILVRAVIVFFAGIYNPSRQAIVQELVVPEKLRAANATFTTLFAILHSVGPMAGALAYQHFGGVHEIFLTNVVTYFLGASLLYQVRYSRPTGANARLRVSEIVAGVREGLSHVRSRGDLAALLRNFSVGGICLGVFYPSLLPFIAETFQGDERIYGKILLAFGLGGIVGGAYSTVMLRHVSKGKVLVTFGFLQAVLFLAWTQVRELYFSYFLIFIWGAGMVMLITTYINYVQVNVSSQFQARAFSLYDQAISLSVVIGAAIVLAVGNRLTATELMTMTAVGALFVLLVQLVTSQGVRSLFYMET